MLLHVTVIVGLLVLALSPAHGLPGGLPIRCAQAVKAVTRRFVRYLERIECGTAYEPTNSRRRKHALAGAILGSNYSEMPYLMHALQVEVPHSVGVCNMQEFRKSTVALFFSTLSVPIESKYKAGTT